MRVVRVRIRALLRRMLWCLAVLLAVAVLLPEPPPRPPPHSPRRHLPLSYWAHRARHPHKYTRSGCISPLELHGTTPRVVKFWQRVTIDDERAVLVFAAYWDTRAEPLVRLLVHSEQEEPKLKCLFWYYDTGDPVSVAATLFPRVDPSASLVVTCVPPAGEGPAPSAVSLVEERFLCGMTLNILTIQGSPPRTDEASSPAPDPRRRDLLVGVCLVWWRRGDAAARFAEWMQLMNVFGVHKVYLYINSNVHENVLHAVDYYSTLLSNGSTVLDVMPYSSPPHAATTTPKAAGMSSRTRARPAAVDFQEYQYEQEQIYDTVEGLKEPEPEPILKSDLLPYNECVYRALGESVAWLALLDIDEIIVPIRDGTWPLLTSKESRVANFQLDAHPDVLRPPRCWFLQALQDLATTSYEKPNENFHDDGELAVFLLSSAKPPLVPPGRIFAYEKRVLSDTPHESVTGVLLRTASVVRVGPRDVACLQSCTVRAVDGEAARIHQYLSGCGGLSRSRCRALGRRGAKDGSLRAWRRAHQDAALALHRMRLRPHRPEPGDDE